MQPPPMANPKVMDLSIPSSNSTQTGLTALHIAVINNDRKQVRDLLASKEHGVDERTPMGATSLMLASLYGRFDMFTYLLHKSASVFKQDFQGFDCSDYVRHLAFTKPLLERLDVVASEKPYRSGRKIIYGLVRPLSSAIKEGRLGSSEKVQASPPEAPLGEKPERRIVSLRKDGIFEIGEFNSLALVEWPFNLGRKTCAAVRASDDEIQYRAIAISGWRGDEAVQVVNVAECLNNATFFKLTRDLAKIVGFEFKSMYLDYRHKGNPSEKAGAFHACHAEKQLAVFVLTESMACVLGTREFSLDNMDKLKLAVTKDASTVQKEYIIELEHKPCSCCIAFLNMIYEKTGIHFEWLQRQWFSEGKRPQLRPKDGLKASQQKDLNTIQDVIDVADDDWHLVPESDITTPTTAAATDVDDDDDTDGSWVIVRRSKPQNPRRKRQDGIPTKAGSEVGSDDFPVPARKNISKRLLLKQKRRQKQKMAASHQLPLSSDMSSTDPSSQDTLSPETPSTASSSSQAIKGPITPINFEIPIRRVRTSAANEPFPKMSEFMSRWGASE